MTSAEHSGEIERIKCVGTGLYVTNVGRGHVGHRLPMMGDCSACGSRVEITKQWTAKWHTRRVIRPATTGETHA